MKILIIISFLLLSFSVHSKVIERIVAIVNDTIITTSDLNNFRKKLKSGGLIDDALLRLTNVKVLVKNKKALLNHMIDERILDSEVKKQGLSVTIEKVEQEIRNISKKNRISRSQLKSALKEKGVRFSDYQDFIKTTLERQGLIEKAVTSKIKISDDDISSYYVLNSKNKKSLTFEYTLSHILFLSKKEGAMKRARGIAKKLESGEDFNKMASKYSEDPQFSQGGLLGTFKAQEMIPEFLKAISTLEVGEFSKPTKTRAGYHIIKVLNKRLVTDPRLEKEKGRIRNILFAESFKKQFRNWLDDKRKDSYIRIN